MSGEISPTQLSSQGGSQSSFNGSGGGRSKLIRLGKRFVSRDHDSTKVFFASAHSKAEQRKRALALDRKGRRFAQVMVTIVIFLLIFTLALFRETVVKTPFKGNI